MNDTASPRPAAETAPADLEGRTVIITGAGQGIGAEYARAFAAAGSNVVAADINGEAVADLVRDIAGNSGRAIAVTADVADEESTRAMAAAALEAYGRIDVLINNAALYSQVFRGIFDEIPLDEWRQVMDVNVTGSFLCARAVLPAMRERGWGRIVNISSSTVAMGRPNFLHYVTSKAAVVGMTRSMAREIGGDGITVNCVMPGLTDTGIETTGVDEGIRDFIVRMQAIPRREVPNDLAGTIMFLASDASGFVTGQTIAVDGGTIHL